MKIKIYAFILLITFFPISAKAHPGPPFYDYNALTYLSTDIVIATLVKKPGSASDDDKMDIIVKETLYGDLHKNERIPGFLPYLNWSPSPLKSGQNVILFLNKHPDPNDSSIVTSPESPFIIVESGTLLIDEDQYVYRTYDATDFKNDEEKRKKLEEYGIKNLSYIKNEIKKSIKYVEKIRPILTGNTGEFFVFIQDCFDFLPFKTHKAKLIETLKERKDKWDSFYGDPISNAVFRNINKLNDPRLQMEAYYFSPNQDIARNFTQNGQPGDEDFQKSRVDILLSSLSDVSEKRSLRIAAAQILTVLTEKMDSKNSCSDYECDMPRNGGIWVDEIKNNHWISDHISLIESAAQKIFDNENEDEELRLECLNILNVYKPDQFNDMKKVYSLTHSNPLKFSIEKLFLKLSDSSYKSLQPDMQPATSLISVQRDNNDLPSDKVSFLAEYYEERKFHDRERKEYDDAWQKEIQKYPRRNPESFVVPTKQKEFFVLTNKATRQNIKYDYQGLSNGGNHGENYLDLDTVTNLPAGNYELTYEYWRDNKPVAKGYPFNLSVVQSNKGNVIQIDQK